MPALALGEAPLDELRRVLRSPGIGLDLGSATVALRSRSEPLARQLAAVYPHFQLSAAAEFSDIHVEIGASSGWRRWIRPQAHFACDGESPFEPFSADIPLPLFEWGVNWLIGQRMNNQLMFHAGCLERGGHGILLPAVPGSGKSTLTAALAHRGWRLLSDEFGVYDLGSARLRAMLKPIALKNESIAVIRAVVPTAVFGPEFPNTRRGRVAHVAATADAVARRAQGAAPALVVLPQWTAGRATSLEPLAADALFRALAYNSFNYEVLGQAAFEAVIALTRRCRGWRLDYSDLDDAVARLNELWADLPEIDDAAG